MCKQMLIAMSSVITKNLKWPKCLLLVKLIFKGYVVSSLEYGLWTLGCFWNLFEGL